VRLCAGLTKPVQKPVLVRECGLRAVGAEPSLRLVCAEPTEAALQTVGGPCGSAAAVSAAQESLLWLQQTRTVLASPLLRTEACQARDPRAEARCQGVREELVPGGPTSAGTGLLLAVTSALPLFLIPVLRYSAFAVQVCRSSMKSRNRAFGFSWLLSVDGRVAVLKCSSTDRHRRLAFAGVAWLFPATRRNKECSIPPLIHGSDSCEALQLASVERCSNFTGLPNYKQITGTNAG